MNNINLEWYETFRIVAMYQNYRKASEKLFLSVSTIRAQIKNLEGVLSVRLFEKNERNIYLTEAGKKFYPIATRTLEAVGKDVAEMQNSKYSAKLNIGVSTYVSTYIIPKFLPIFFKHAPDIELSIKVCDEYLTQKIDEYIIDIGIDRKMSNSERLEFQEVCEGSIRLIVPDTFENEELFREIDYFKKYRILSGTHPLYWDKLSEEIKDLYPDADFINIEDVKSVETLIGNQQGISYLPLYILKNREIDKIKVVPPYEITPPASFTYLIWKRLTEPIDTFLKLFEEYIRDEQI